MRSSLKALLCASVAAAGLPAQSSNNLSGISGVLTTETGKAVDAVIRAYLVNASPFAPAKSPAPSGPPVYAYITAKKSAAFSFTSLAAGMYELCATVPDGGYVDPCLWEAHGVIVNVPANQVVTGISINLKKSSTLKVHVDDPSKAVRNGAQGAMAMGVFGSGGRFYPLVLKNDNGSGKDYELAVPFDRDLNFFVRPVGLTAVDSNNASVDSGSTLKLRHPSNGPPPGVLNYRVTGKK